MSSKQATQKANDILRKAGFTWSGRSQKDVNPAQSSFERRLLINPVSTAR